MNNRGKPIQNPARASAAMRKEGVAPSGGNGPPRRARTAPGQQIAIATRGKRPHLAKLQAPQPSKTSPNQALSRKPFVASVQLEAGEPRKTAISPRLAQADRRRAPSSPIGSPIARLPLRRPGAERPAAKASKVSRPP
jgi:hypothetical protein